MEDEHSQNKEHDNSFQRKVGLVGGGQGAAKLLPILLQVDSVQVDFVADRDEKAPAMELAREEGIKVSTDLIKSIKRSELDLVFELTGSKEVLTTIETEISEEVKVISGRSSYFIFNIIEEYKTYQQKLLTNINNHLKEIYKKIEGDSRNVNDLLTEIKKTTKQLDRLAINASIEANKAGEKGRGFSIVAEEVKGLAGESNSLVENIEEINNDILGLNERITEVATNIESQEERLAKNNIGKVE